MATVPQPPVAGPAGANGQGPSLSEQIQEWFDTRWNDLKQAYSTYHQMVWLCILMYSGQLWIHYDKTRKVFIPISPDDDWTPQPNINRFSPACDAVASVFAQVPEVEAEPREENNTEAHDVAEVANALARYVRDTSGYVEQTEGEDDAPGLAQQLFVLAGCAFTIIDPYIKEMAQTPVMGEQEAWGVQCPTCDTYETMPMDPAAPPPMQACPKCGGPLSLERATTTAPTGQVQEQARWGLRIRVGSPLNSIPQLGAKSMADSRYHLWAERLPIEEIFERWKFEAEPDQEQLDNVQGSWETQLNYFYTGYSASEQKAKESALVVQIFIQPGKLREFPKGCYAVYCNERIIHAVEWDFVAHPLTKGSYLNLPNTFHGRSIAFDLSEIQREINRYEAIIALHGMTGAAEPIVADENTKVSNITGRGDKVIWWRSIGGGAKEPHRMRHEQLSEGVFRKLQELKAEMENISGAVSVFKGEQPGSITAASAISQLRGQAEMKFGKPVRNWNALWRETIAKAVKALQRLLQPWEIAEIMGEGHDMQVLQFKNADLDKLLKWVTTSHGLPRTRDEKRMDMLELFDRGALDVTDPNVRQKIYDLFGETGMMKQFNKDATRARKENQDIKNNTGIPVLMPEIEDLAVHFQIHAEAIKSLDFDNWPMEAKEMMMAHALQTKMALMEQAAMAEGAGAEGEGEGEGEGEDGAGEGGGARAGSSKGEPKGTPNPGKKEKGGKSSSAPVRTNTGPRGVATGPNNVASSKQTPGTRGR